MAKLKRRGSRPRGKLGLALLLWDVWRRIPPKQRKRLLALARRHGPRLARTAYKARRAAKRRTRR